MSKTDSGQYEHDFRLRDLGKICVTSSLLLYFQMLVISTQVLKKFTIQLKKYARFFLQIQKMCALQVWKSRFTPDCGEQWLFNQNRGNYDLMTRNNIEHPQWRRRGGVVFFFRGCPWSWQIIAIQTGHGRCFKVGHSVSKHGSFYPQ